MSKDPKSDKDAHIVQCLTSYKTEADSARKKRMQLNQDNFDCYHLEQDWSHKKAGQSKEFLAKQAMAVEQITSFIQQGLIDLGEWFSIEQEDGAAKPKIGKDEVKKLLSRQLDKANFFNVVGDAIKLGLLGSLMIAKVHGKTVSKPVYTAKESVADDGQVETTLYRREDKVWQLQVDALLQKDYYPDPSGRGLYEMEELEMDLFEVKRLVKSKSNPEGIYDKEAVDQLVADLANLEEEAKKARMTGQNVPESGYRKRVKVLECWGTILGPDGEILHENVVTAIANDRFVIRPPQKNPFWHGQSPYVVSPIIRVPKSVWHKALMDAPTKHNHALNEIYNLNLDAGMMAAFGIKQLRPDWLEDTSQVNDGIHPGMTLEVNSSCPPGAKVLERVDTASMSPESLSIFNLTDKEFQTSALTNDLRLGVIPSRAVKATEVVEASQSITTMLNGIAKVLENDWIRQVLTKSWMTSIQHVEDFDDAEVQKLLGTNRAMQLKTMARQARFSETVNGLTFSVFGISHTLNKMKDFRRITAFLQTIAGSEILVEEFAKKYSFSKLLLEIMKALDLNPDKIKLEDEEQVAQELTGLLAGGGESGGPDMQSQIPQVASDRSGAPETPGQVPSANFPPSKATGAFN